MGYESTLAAAAGSLGRLGLRYLDLYLVHAPGGSRQRRKDTWRAMLELQARGLCRAVGVSNYEPRHLEELAPDCAPAVNQVEYHPACQQRELAAYCAARGVALMAHSPFGGRNIPVLRDRRVAAAAAGCGLTPAQLVLRWAVQAGVVAASVPKTESAHRLRENLAAGPGRPGAVKRPGRFPMKTHFEWGFCMGAQGA